MLGSVSNSLSAGLPALVRQFSAPALATKSSSGGIASLLGFGGDRIETPLSEPLPSAPKPLKGSVPTVAPKLETGSLESGTKVAAIDTASPITTVSLVFEGGSAYETDATLGASKVLEAMAFKATANRTTFRLTRELEKIGATASAVAGREHFAYSLSAVKLNTPEAVEMLVDAACNPKLNYWEVAETVESVKQQLKDALKRPENLVSEVFHRAAYEGALGQPLNLDPALLHDVTNATVKEFLAATFNPSKAVLAAAGTNLGEFKQLANPLVSATSGATAPKPSSTYTGGSLNVIANSPLTYIALGFEAQGGLSDPKAAAAAAVVRALLDDSRAVLPFTRKESDVLRSASGFSNLYSSTGLVGVLASTAPAQASAAVDAVVQKVEGVAKGVPEAQLRLAKQLAIGAYKASIASSSGLVAAMAPQILLKGSFDANEFVSKVEALTAADVAAFVSKGLKAGPTMVTYGSMSSRVPRYDTVVKRLA